MNAFDRLVAEETAYLTQTFLAPSLKDMPIRVRIAGIALHLKPSRTTEGWYIWRPAKKNPMKAAQWVRKADLAERRRYLDLFPKLQLILCRRIGEQWYGMVANRADSRFRMNGLIPVHLAEGVQLFETVHAAFDGSLCWFDCISSRYPRIPMYLREGLVALTEPNKLAIDGMTPETRDAYIAAYVPAVKADIESKKDQQEERIKRALEHAGAEYRGYVERGESYTIEYIVDGDHHRSTVDKKTLQVQSAGICLDGTDGEFDLQSLISVLREGKEEGKIVRVGDNRR